ncbi:MAG: hypothetical protein ACJA1L_002678, partial [Paracoccaceae bacterium]
MTLKQRPPRPRKTAADPEARAVLAVWGWHFDMTEVLLVMSAMMRRYRFDLHHPERKGLSACPCAIVGPTPGCPRPRTSPPHPPRAQSPASRLTPRNLRWNAIALRAQPNDDAAPRGGLGKDQVSGMKVAADEDF